MVSLRNLLSFGDLAIARGSDLGGVLTHQNFGLLRRLANWHRLRPRVRCVAAAFAFQAESRVPE